MNYTHHDADVRDREIIVDALLGLHSRVEAWNRHAAYIERLEAENTRLRKVAQAANGFLSALHPAVCDKTTYIPNLAKAEKRLTKLLAALKEDDGE